MIKLVGKGKYSLIETKNDIKVLKLGGRTFVWIYTESVGEILEITHRPHRTDEKLAKGEYRLYEVEHEPKLIDQLHLELSIGEGDWQGYLLPTGFPKGKKNKSRIIPTEELIAK